jgi:alpha-glucuronidase
VFKVNVSIKRKIIIRLNLEKSVKYGVFHTTRILQQQYTIISSINVLEKANNMYQVLG